MMIDLFSTVIFTLLLFGAGYLIVKRAWPIERWQVIFFSAFWIRVVVSLILSRLFLFDDETNFYLSGVSQRYGFFSFYPDRMYHNIVTILYGLFGSNILIGKIFNSFLGAVSSFVMFDLGKRVTGSNRAAYYSMLLFAFSPPMVLYSALNLKEIGTILILLLLLISVIKPAINGRRKVFEIPFLMTSLIWFRGYIWTLLASLSLASYWGIKYWSLLTKYLLRIKNKIFLWFILISVLVVKNHQTTTLVFEDASKLINYHLFQFRIPETATVAKLLDLGRTQLFLPNFLVLALRALYSPSPLTPIFDFAVGDIIEGLTTLSWYLIAPFVFLCALIWLRKITPQKSLILILGFALSFLAIISETSRFRVAVFPFAFVMAADGYLKREDKLYKPITIGWWVSVMVFTCLWLTLRLI